MNRKKKINNIIEFIGIFLILLYPYNASIINVIYKNNIICLVSVIIGFILLLISKKNHRINKKIFIYFSITILVLLFTNINNYYYVEGNNYKMIMFSIYLLLPILIYIHGSISGNLLKVIKLFSFEHIVGTFIGLINKDFYKNTILKVICSSRSLCVAEGNYYHGYIPGFTTNFSTNAIYLSIATMVFYSDYLKNKRKSSLFFLILSLISLFVSGKRGQLIFTILGCLLLFILRRNKKTNIVKKSFGVIIISLLSIAGFVLLAKYIPEMNNVITRFELLIDNGDVLNGRGELYTLALDTWSNHILIGNGWGSFSYYYQLYLYHSGSLTYWDAHNVYLQLLCEVGIIGLVLYLVFTISYLIKIINNVNYKSNNEIYYFIFLYSVFFVLYSFTGNPLYDPMCYVLYFICIGLSLGIQKEGNDQL